MADFVNINANVKKQLESKGFYMDCEFSLDNAASIVNLGAKAFITGTETLMDEIRVSGRVCFNIIYMDSEDSLRCEECVQNFEQTMEAPGITPQDYSMVTISVADTDYMGVSNVKARATLELAGCYIVKRQISIMDSECREVLCRKDMISYQNMIALPDCVIEFTDNMDIDDNCNRILCSSTKAVITRVMQGNEIITIQGQAITLVFYVADGALKSKEYINDFSGEIISEDINLDTRVCAVAMVASDGAKLVETKRGKECAVSFTIKLSCMVACRGSVQVITDAYSIDYECALKKEEYAMDTIHDTIYFTEKVVSNIEIPAESPPVKSVLFALSPSIGAINLSSADKSNVEGIVSCATIYVNENDKIERVTAEVPYQFKAPFELVSRQLDCLQAQVATIGYKLKHNRGIEITMDLAIAASSRTPGALELISEAVTGEEKEKSDYAITCVIAGPDDDLWKISKLLNVESNKLLAANRDLQLPLKGGEKIIYYRMLD
jgi:hypothetical protein